MVSAVANRYSMPMLKRSATLRILSALPLASLLAWALRGAAQTDRISPPIRAGQLNGMKVEALDGQKIGWVHNLVLDMRSGELKYVVIASGGFFGVHPTLKLVPSRIVSAATTKRGTLAIFTTAGIWNAAPVFKPSELASYEDPERSREITRYFQTSGPPPMTTNGRSLSKTGADTNLPRTQLRFAGNLIDTRVVNQKQEKIGEVLDILVGLGPPHAAYAVIGSGRFLRRGQEYAVPLSALKSLEHGRKLLLDVQDPKWDYARPFDEHAWNTPATNGSVRVYSYSQTEN